MFWITGLFSIWVILMLVKGYLRGLWITVFELCGLVAGYIACFIWGQPVVGLLQAQGIAPQYAFIGGFLVLFFVVNMFVAYTPRLLLADALEKQGKLRRQGAGLGALMGVVSGLVLVWCFNFVRDVIFVENNASVGREKPPEFIVDKLLKNSANSMMGSVSEVGVRVAGASEAEAELVSALTKSPGEFVQGMQKVAKSDAMKKFIRDAHVQRLMATDNIDALLANFRFQSLMSEPGMQQLRGLVHKDNQQELQAQADEGEPVSVQLDRHLAKHLSYLWRRIAVIKGDERVKDIMRDPEIQRLVEEKNPVALMTNSKAQELLHIMMEDNPEFANIDYTQFVQDYDQDDNRESYQGEDTELLIEDPPIEIYRWVDSTGRVQYSEKEDIPEERIDTAERFK